jgi:phage terminase large subunit-like protein
VGTLNLDIEELQDLDLDQLLEAEAEWLRYNQLEQIYSEDGPFGISKYAKHREIFEATAKYDHVCAMGGNGTGKTYGIGGYLTTLHLTGLYPRWWKGLRFPYPIKARACGDTRQTMREVIQPVLFGDFAEKGEEFYGTGLIPRHLLLKRKIVSNTNGLIDYAAIRHVPSNGISTLQLRAYEQGREAFQGTKFHWIWEDEEPDNEIHEENEMRGRGVDGKILLTFTPLSGFSEVVESFLKFEETNKQGGSMYCAHIAWNDVPHLTEEWKRKRLAKMKPHLRKSRVFGIPSGGDAMVYPVDEEFIICKPFPIPDHFRRVAGFDHGWHNTAAVWVAYDKDEDMAYIYGEYKRGEVTIEVHATALKARGAWIPFLGDSSARDSDGTQIVNKYKTLGVRMRLPDKAVDAGIQEVLERLDSGRLKIFSTCPKWIEEYRRYRYKADTNGIPQVVKQNDHLMDATRYAIYAGLKVAEHNPGTRTPRDITSNMTF